MAYRTSIVAIVVGALALSANLFLTAQQTDPAKLKAKPKPAMDRFEFEVVQSFNAKYEGDTPGHVGRNGGLADRRPHVALGDPVFRGEEQIGQITELGWSRVHGSLEIEFDPVPGEVCVGDQVWLYLEGPPAVRK